jgi:hypothetical protein
VCD